MEIVQAQEAREPSEHQISFTVENIGLIASDLKDETRRLVRFQPPAEFPFVQLRDGRATWSAEKPGDFPMWERSVRSPYGVVGDILWVRETWQLVRVVDESSVEVWREKIPESKPDGWDVWFKANLTSARIGVDIPWRPNIFMPRWACARLLKVESIHVERLHDITPEGARAEGMESVERYMKLWDSINAKKAPASTNPWVWVIRFSKLELS